MTIQRERSVPQADPARVPVQTRWKRFYVEPGFLLQILTEGWRGDGWHTVSGIPKDAAVVSAYFDKEAKTYTLIVAHGSFPALAPGSLIPLSTVRIEDEGRA